MFWVCRDAVDMRKLVVVFDPVGKPERATSTVNPASRPPRGRKRLLIVTQTVRIKLGDIELKDGSVTLSDQQEATELRGKSDPNPLGMGMMMTMMMGMMMGMMIGMMMMI